MIFEYTWHEMGFSRNPYWAGRMKEIRHLLPDLPGVYVVRCPEPFPRVFNESPVVLIGHSGGGGGGGPRVIADHLFNAESPDLALLGRIESMYPKHRFVLEVHSIQPQDGIDNLPAHLARLEDTLLRAYLSDHLELPPANHRSLSTP